MTTTRQQVEEALEEGDTLESIICFYHPFIEKDRYESPQFDNGRVIACPGNELPTRTYSAGYGGVEGEPCICFGAHRIYVKTEYDGAESFRAIPRTPDDARTFVPDAL